MENSKLFELIMKSVEGDTKSIFEIILNFQNLICKEARINGEFNQECKDYIEDNLIKYIKTFKKYKNF